MDWNKRCGKFNEAILTQVLWKDVVFDEWQDLLRDLSKNNRWLSRLEDQQKIIAKIIYKHSNQMRRDVSFQHFKKVHKLIQRLFVDLDIQTIVVEYADILKAMLKNRKVASNTVDLPSSAYSRHLLCITLGASKLLLQIAIACQKAFVGLDAHMRYGFFVSFNLFAIASVSRIWHISNEWTHQMTKLYKTLKTVLSEDEAFLPIDDVLANDWKLIAKSFLHTQTNKVANAAARDESVVFESLPDRFDSGEPISLKAFMRENSSGKIKEFNGTVNLPSDENILMLVDSPDQQLVLGKAIAQVAFMREKMPERSSEPNDTVFSSDKVSGEPVSRDAFMHEKLSINKKNKFSEIDPSQTFSQISSKIKSRMRCPLCGKTVFRLTPTFVNKRHYLIKRDDRGIRSADDKYKYWARMLSLKHQLLHSYNLKTTKRLMISYRQLRKNKKL